MLLETRLDIRVVFTDIEMPGSMNGLKLAFAVRDRWPPVTIVIASGCVRPQLVEMPTEVTFLLKPYGEAAVLDAIRPRRALQLLILRASESIGHHDSEIMDVEWIDRDDA